MTKKHITASDLYNFKKCRFKPYLDWNGNPAIKMDVHPLVKLLWEAGVQYEAKVIENFKADNPSKSFISIRPDKPASVELFEETRDAMAAGADFIYQGVLVSNIIMGRPDLLVKEPGRSNFGDFIYYPIDIKLARVEDTWDDGNEKPTQEQWWQMYFYADLLEQVQGARPLKSYIYKTKNRLLYSNPSKKPPQYDEAMSLLEAYRNGDGQGSEPAISSICSMCEWKNYCVDWAKNKNDITLLYWVGQAMKYGFRELGIQTIDDLLERDPDELLVKVQELKTKGFFWKTMSDSKVLDAMRRAKVSKDQKPVIYAAIEFPNTDVEIHYDIEDDPTQDFVYLHGALLVEKGKTPIYHYFFADSPNDEQKITEELFDFFKSYPGATVYHYAEHEKTVLKRLITKYPSLDQSVFDLLFGNNGSAIDLFDIIDTKTDWPLTSYSLKSICKYLGFKWAADDASGAASVVWINDYLKGDKSMKDKILKYNENDCEAMLFLKGQLIERQASSF